MHSGLCARTPPYNDVSSQRLGPGRGCGNRRFRILDAVLPVGSSFGAVSSDAHCATLGTCLYKLRSVEILTAVVQYAKVVRRPRVRARAFEHITYGVSRGRSYAPQQLNMPR